jgi:hypothetical protein
MILIMCNDCALHIEVEHLSKTATTAYTGEYVTRHLDQKPTHTVRVTFV